MNLLNLFSDVEVIPSVNLILMGFGMAFHGHPESLLAINGPGESK
jgi:hypothetical protein